MCAVEWKSLEELGNFYGGLSGKSKEDFQDGNAKFVTYMNVYSNMSLDLTIVDMVKVGEDEKQNSIKYGDILFTGSSETPDDCGMSCVVTRHIDEPIYLNSFCFGFRFDDVEKFEPDFLKHYFRCIAMRKAISLTASGVTRFNVSKKRFGKIQIPLLHVSKQQEIVSHLDTFTTLISNLESELDMRREQYEHYRNQLLDFEGVKGVEWKTLGEFCKFKYGYTAKADDNGSYRYIRITDIDECGRLYKDNAKYIGEYDDLNGYVLKKNDIVVARTGATFGKTLIFEADYPAVYASFLIKIDLKGILLNKYYWHFAQSKLYWMQANKLVGGGAQPQFNTGALSQIIIPIPSLSIQREIVEKLDAFENLIQSLEQEIKLRKQQYEYYREKLLTF